MSKPTKLQTTYNQWKSAGLPAHVVLAPKEAKTFDRMLIVYSDQQYTSIRRVSLYDSKTDRFIAEY